MCIMLVKDYPMGKKTKPYSLEQSSLKFQESVFFKKCYKGHKLSKNKVQWLDLASRLWPTLIGLLFASTVLMHF
jgi:hypothetical protein